MTLLKSPLPFCSLTFIDELPRMREVDDRLKEALRDGVSVTRILTEHKADEIAAALHAEMPWMAPAT
jgi:hypothetical protein